MPNLPVELSVKLEQPLRPASSFKPKAADMRASGKRIYGEIDVQMKTLFEPLEAELAKFLNQLPKLTLTVTAADKSATYTGKSNITPAQSADLGTDAKPKTQTFTFQKQKDGETTLPETLELQYSDDKLSVRKSIDDEDHSLIQWVKTKEAIIKTGSQSRFIVSEKSDKVNP